MASLGSGTFPDAMDNSWTSSAQDFGQKVDLTVRIREILRNYPEGLSILKELIQNADDAGARTIRFCTAEARPSTNNTNTNTAMNTASATDALSQLMKGPSLLANNTAQFTDTDFQSIQRIGDSLKKDKNGTKTGRFGVGVNSTYHLTDVPMFVSGTKVVLFDPQASFVPGINPANPGKMIDLATTNGRNLVSNLPSHVFGPLKAFGNQLDGQAFDGTTFRFALRTEEQAKKSRLSTQHHPLQGMRDLLREMASSAPTMLLFLKNIECIEIYDWKATEAGPTLIHRTNVSSVTENVRMRRSYVLTAPSRVPPKPQAIDYIMDIQSQGVGTTSNGGKAHATERWIVCNQLGGGTASTMAKDPSLSHMKLVPWAGVAARLSPPPVVDDGAAYCFLPLPVRTKLPIHINGYFELSSNRRDVWWGDDMAGDGKARAKWNESIVADIAAPSYCRLVAAAIKTNSVTSDTYEFLFPQRSLAGPWKILGDKFFRGVTNLPVLYSKSYNDADWIAPSQSLLLHDDNDKQLEEILSLERLPLVLVQSKELKAELLSQKINKGTTTSTFIRQYFSQRRDGNGGMNGALEVQEKKLEFAEYLLALCLSDLNPSQYGLLSGCQFVPLSSGNLGRLCTLPSFKNEALAQLQTMGFSKLQCIHALRSSKGDVNTSMEWLLSNRYEDATTTTIQYGIDPYLICSGDSASLLRSSAPETFVELDKVVDPVLKKFFSSGGAMTYLNLLMLQPDMLADVVARAIPRDWRGSDSALWKPNDASNQPTIEWFSDLWRFICSCSDVGQSLSAVAEQYCIVPTKQEMVCSLSPGNSVLDSTGLEDEVVKSLSSLGTRILYPDVFPSDIVVPEEIWSYIYRPNREGIIKAIETSIRRTNTNTFDSASDDIRKTLFRFFSVADGPISDAGLKTLRTFPIFSAYCNTHENTKTRYVSMVKSGTWFVLEDATEEDCVFLGSDFLAYSSNAEMELLILLGARKMKRTEFFAKVVVPQLTVIDQESCNKVVMKILIDVPSLITSDPSFEGIISNTKCIPSAVSGSLKSPLELYDPEVSQLQTLMDEDCFPNEFYCAPPLLLSLRSLGLQSTLTWDVVIDCARSIEQESASEELEKAKSANSRAKELLAFLDMNVNEFFPEFEKEKKKNQSRTSRLFHKMNKVLFEDAEEKKKRQEKHAERIQILLSLKWIPVILSPPHPCLPWPEDRSTVAAPIDTATTEQMWLHSYSKRLVDGNVHSVHLRKLFGWHDEVSIRDVAMQLRILGKIFNELREKLANGVEIEAEGDGKQITLNILCQKVTSEVGRIYQILNSVSSEYEVDVMKSILHECVWLWMGDNFVSSDHMAFSSPINATPYLFTVPPDLACFRNLLAIFKVRDSFGSSDYCSVLRRMSNEKEVNEKWEPKYIELAVGLVQKISDDVLKLRDMEIYAPTQEGTMRLASDMVYDDAPWLSKDLPGKKELIYAHPKLSASVAEKVGIKSVRKLLLQSNTNMINFGDGVVHEAFGQSESLTRRLKNIVEMYPEGPQQLNELIQNADDAKASIVRFVVSKKSHGKSSLLGQKLSEWQGPALYCYNDATFTSRDFQNLAKIGQASKLEKLVTTGRFGLGFNSVFHWTDVPSFVSGDHLVMFDPHAKYVPGATDMSRGIKIRFTHSELADQFPDQMLPYCLFGNDMRKRFNGTLFRFPFRSSSVAAESEISKTQYGEDDAIEELLKSYKKTIQRVLLFLRHVNRVEIYIEEADDAKPRLLYFADAIERKALVDKSPPKVPPPTSLSGLRSFTSTSVFGGGGAIVKNQDSDWNAIASFILGSESQSLSKEAFYNKLSRTPENQLPRTKHIITIVFEDKFLHPADKDGNRNNSTNAVVKDKYLICSALGAGECRAMACNEKHRDMKFIPWGSVAAHISRNEQPAPPSRGNAFCFLPLPAETGLPIYINGYFELSANRRDIWSGDDMSGAGQVRSQWNRLLLGDVISPLYSQLLFEARSVVGPGKQYNSLWPIEISSDVWKIVRSTVYKISEGMPLLYSLLGEGKWVSMQTAICLDATNDSKEEMKSDALSNKKKLMNILLQENINVVSIPSAVITCMKTEGCRVNEVNRSMVREWYKAPVEHMLLRNRENAIFILRYCIEDLMDSHNFGELLGLPLLPLLDGGLGTIGKATAVNQYFVPNQVEKGLLSKASHYLIDVWTYDDKLNGYLNASEFHQLTNVGKLDLSNFVTLLSDVYPNDWQGLSEMRWIPDTNSSKPSPENPLWISKLWDYLASSTTDEEKDLSIMENTWQIVPTLGIDGEKNLHTLSKRMAVVDLTNPHTGKEDNMKVGHIIRSIGVKSLDSSILKGNDRGTILRKLKPYLQPPTVRGVLTALINSYPVDMASEFLMDKISSRFQNVSHSDRSALQLFFRDSDYTQLKENEIGILRSLPIYEVYNSSGNKTFSHLLDDRFLPPPCADSKLLDATFVRASTQRDVEFYEKIGVTNMSQSHFYEHYLCPALISSKFEKEARDVAITRFLLDLPRLVEGDDGPALISRLSKAEIVPNYRGQMTRPIDLYDPQEAGLADLIDKSMLPAKGLHQATYLQSLRMLGMRKELSSDGVIESARQIEYQAKTLSTQDSISEMDVNAVRQRAQSLLQFLDNDAVLKSYLKNEEGEIMNEISVSNAERQTEEEIEVSAMDYPTEMMEELCEISWLPVVRSKSNGETIPRKKHQLSFLGIAPPKKSRPKADEWLCSSSMDILATTIRSETLLQCFGWDKRPDVLTVASQVVALSKVSYTQANSQMYKQTLSTVTSQIYEILDGHLRSAPTIEEQEKMLILFQQSAWIWVGDRFVSTNQVAFDAPDNAKPFLYSVPDQMQCFGTLLKACGVRDAFSGQDFIMLLSSLAGELQGNPCDRKQMDLAIFVARYLSRISPEEMESLDKSQIYLPSEGCTMHPATEMTCDDAPWLSAIVKRSQHIFVHKDIGVDTARVLGAKSLRDVLSAHQNGMVKIPCTKSEALRELLSKRQMTLGEKCRSVVELLEIAELKGAKQVSITLDERSHGALSLLHPCLAPAQGPALVVCYHDVAMEIEEVVRLTSPARYYSRSVSGENGCGGTGFPRFGRGLCAGFTLTDCLQVLSGKSLMIFDPNGEYFIEDGIAPKVKSNISVDVKENKGDKEEQNVTEKVENDTQEINNDDTKQDELTTEEVKTVRKGKATARNYGLSSSLCKQFPDQFDPFLTLPFGVAESMNPSQSCRGRDSNVGGPFFRGTIIRIPLRNASSPPSSLCDCTTEEEDFASFLSELEGSLPKSLLFTYNLQSVNLNVWRPTDTVTKSIVECSVGSSLLSRMNHQDALRETTKWKKDKSKIGKLFSNSWSPERFSYTLQINHRHITNEEQVDDVIDTYMVSSVLAPPRLREMACTEALKPLNLLPAVTIAAHIHRSCGNNVLETNAYTVPDGTIFVGMDTGVKTGLPFLMNVPLFLHEWMGSVLLQKDDDADFKRKFPGVRDVIIEGKHSHQRERKTLALYAWNQQALSSCMLELIPSLLMEMREPLQHSYSKNARLLYKFWPYFSRIQPRFQSLIDQSLYEALSNSQKALYLTETSGFQSIKEGRFASPDYTLTKPASDFFLDRMALFTTPKLVVEDLNRFGIGTHQLTPATARKFLKKEKYLRILKLHGVDNALALLEYCLADLIPRSAGNNNEVSFGVGSKGAIVCQELMGLHLLPLADGTIGTIGNEVIIASELQQSMLPQLQHRFLATKAVDRLEYFVSREGFCEACGITRFSPKILAKHISTVLPSSWVGKDFVTWNPEENRDNPHPSRGWIYQFWREVDISCYDQVSYFRRYPLIPTTTGELVSCGNVKYILGLCPQSNDSPLRRVLLEAHEATVESYKRLAANNDGTSLEDGNDVMEISGKADTDFWNMGEISNTVEGAAEEENDMNIMGSDLSLNEDSDMGEENPLLIDEDASSAEEPPAQQDNGNDTDININININRNDTNAAIGTAFDPDSPSFHDLKRILLAIQVPLLETSYFTEDELKRSLPTDRLGMSRAVMSTLNQCTNYWTLRENHNDNIEDQQQRLRWSELASDDYNNLILHLTQEHEGNRISLMTSDLQILKKLPVFETFSGSHVSLSDSITNGEHFTLDASVDIGGVRNYLPHSIQSQLLVEKVQFKDLYQDLQITGLNEATILQKFVLPEFENMSIGQKEAVIQNLFTKWSILRLSDILLETLKETPFVKKQLSEDSDEVVFVTPNEVYDPENTFFSKMFDTKSNFFPVEEFLTEEALEILRAVGLKTSVDKETFLNAAYTVEQEQNVTKAIQLFEYFAEHFGDFFDNHQDFTQKLATVRCVPAEMEGQPIGLHCFRETTAPKDRHLTCNVMPVIHTSATPPQVLFSSLGIVSPPPLSAVLKNLKALTEDQGILDHWTYSHGSVDTVFSSIFSFIQDNFSSLSPRVKEALKERAIVPVGTTLVKGNRLFFRLAKDLAPFFYEVPRAFGACDVLFRELGVRESPESGDYALSLAELKNEIGSGKLNANELKSVVEVVLLIAANESISSTGEDIYAPDSTGRLVNTKDLLQNDCVWLVQSGRLNTNLIHIAHPKLPEELCSKLRIGRLSESIREVIDDGFVARELNTSSTRLANLEGMIKSDSFVEVFQSLIPKTFTKRGSQDLKLMRVSEVESIQTQLVLLRRSRNIDVTNRVGADSVSCFIDKNKILISQLPVGLSCELAVATALCDEFQIDRKHVAGLSAILSSHSSVVPTLQRKMGLFQDENNAELLRGEPGELLVETDSKLASIKPMKVFSKGEIVAIHKGNEDSSPLIYGVVVASEEGASLSRLRICVAPGKEVEYLSSQVFSLMAGSSAQQNSSSMNDEINISELRTSVNIQENENNDDMENFVVSGDGALAPVQRQDVLTAVQDLLKSANLSLNHDMKTMLDSNLALQEQLTNKDVRIEDLTNKTRNLSSQLTTGMDTFLCPITRDVMEDPVICADGHTYERHAIELWLRSHSRSPKTNQELPSTHLIPNHALRSTIVSLKECTESLEGME